jgi:hypothetical protein
MIVIGIDPDSAKHGVAIYQDGSLIDLELMQLVEVLSLIDFHTGEIGIDKILVSIEDVCANTFIYTRNKSSNPRIMAKIGLAIGKCQQSQTELVRFLDAIKVKYQLHKPQKGNWAKNKKQFEKVTGWTQRSNEDTRAAAYFGYLALNN